jgi:hypothetical protein
LWNKNVCCICDDKRPLQKYGYIAYTNPNLDDYTYVTRQHYYCEGCKAYIRFARHHQWNKQANKQRKSLTIPFSNL